MKVIVNMACGLANRMFQYAYYLYLLEEGYDAYVDYFTTATLSHEDVAWLKIFPKATFREASIDDIRRMGGGHSLLAKLRRKFLPFTTNVIETKGAFDITLPPKDKDVYMLGAFQSAKVVTSVDTAIRELFIFPEFESKKNKELQNILHRENSVGIHIRKGKDYQQRIWYKNTCDVDYYKKSVELMGLMVERPHYYVFTDNSEWVKNNMSWLDYDLVEGNPGSGWGSHCDMQLMSLCKHNIISNSTYSWWSAYLNGNPDKKIICPKQWFNLDVTTDFSSKNVLVDNWISL